MAQAKKAAKAAVPMVSIIDFQALEGPLTRNNDQFWTLRGAVVSQVMKDACFSAYAHRDPNAKTPVHDVPSIEDVEQTASPYKDGVDATLVTPSANEFAGKKPRAGLIRAMIDNPEGDPKALDELAGHIKGRAIQEFCQYQATRALGTRSGGSTGIKNRVATGAARLDEQDESWDDAFITKATHFVLETLMTRDFTDDDRINRNYLLGILEGKSGGNETVVPLTVAL